LRLKWIRVFLFFSFLYFIFYFVGLLDLTVGGFIVSSIDLS